ncbi:polysaccharide pyruvyl transferase family protein [Salinivibrio kushneri]|uniref:polysaccharide pyruvyl transferase family protein n=1 Tax=Salinivibrio kushneri TaxID=1908198 RepID=UPI000984F5BD|nr:polysaccharide pyruvyl transferase family protein [Salinivibrio kushneri]OOE62358.1 hypothetical protein BZG18_05295 [Salinivibrio kushneri]
MLVEIKGIGIPNKGAELMLVAVVEEFTRRYGEVDFVVDPNTDFLGRSRYQLYQKGWMNIKGLQIGYLIDFMPNKLLSRFGIKKDKDIDIVVDASGFCYSDSFGPKNAYEQVSRYISRWKRQGKKVAFLPQAYGPFENPKLASMMRSTLEKADIFFARDEQSKKYLEKIGLKDVAQSPDFTCLVEGVIPNDFSTEDAGDVCVILNNRMIEKLSVADGKSYIENMTKMISLLRSYNMRPFFLLHDGLDDKPLTESINNNLEEPLKTYYYEDPKEIKGVISTASIVISSRFHGLVSALTQGIPVIATGWSHKYQMLLDDYNVGDFLADHMDYSDLVKKIELLKDEDKYTLIKNGIVQEKKRQIQKTKDMWNLVFKHIQ